MFWQLEFSTNHRMVDSRIIDLTDRCYTGFRSIQRQLDDPLPEIHGTTIAATSHPQTSSWISINVNIYGTTRMALT